MAWEILWLVYSPIMHYMIVRMLTRAYYNAGLKYPAL